MISRTQDAMGIKKMQQKNYTIGKCSSAQRYRPCAKQITKNVSNATAHRSNNIYFKLFQIFGDQLPEPYNSV